MRTVFFGTPEWAVPSLEALAGGPHRPILSVTQPPKRRGREEDRTGSPVALASDGLGIPRVEPVSARDPELLARLAETRADLFVVVAYGEILSRAVLAVPSLGCVNLHFSLLPRYRGAAPVQWAIANGDEETGVTTMKIVPKLDTGPIYLQETVAIAPGEHADALGRRLSRLGARLLVETVDRLERGPFTPREQDPSAASVARMLTAVDGWVDWTMPAEAIVRRVRAFDPWPGQASKGKTGRIKILEARAATDAMVDEAMAASVEAGRAAPSPRSFDGADLRGAHDGPQLAAAHPRPGQVVGLASDASVVACGEGTAIALLTVRPEGKRSMTGAEALRGRHMSAGEVLGGPTIDRP